MTKVAVRVVDCYVYNLLEDNPEFLILKRNKNKIYEHLWQGVAGKIEKGELAWQTAIRELKEELAIETEASCFAPFTFTSHSYEEFNLLLALFLCRKWTGIVTPLESQVIKWVKPKSLKNFDMPPADKPLIAMLRDFL